VSARLAPLVTIALAASPALAQGPSVGVYAPSLYFQDSTQKALFLSELEKGLTDALGEPVSASFANGPKNMGPMALWLVDAGEAMLKDGLHPVLRAQGASGKSAPVAVYARKSWKPPFELLAKGKIALPGGGGREADVLRYWLLLDEPRSKEIVERARTVRDARAALAAVAAGEADGAIAFKAPYGSFDPQLGALTEVTWLREMPLPVLAVNESAAGKKAADWKKKLARAKLPTLAGMITAWSAVGSDEDLAHIERVLKRKESAVSRELVLAPLPPLQVDLFELIPPPPEPEPLNPIMVMPERRWPPLPDPPSGPPGTPVSQLEGTP
jgi:hypothetical protein